MIESKNYFESYSHFLRNIRSISQLPFQNQIVNAVKEVGPPSYLGVNTIYDVNIGQTKKKIKVLNKEWPKELMGTLDES